MRPLRFLPSLTAAFACALPALWPATPAAAQTLPLARIEVGADAGAALTSSWFRARGAEREPGAGIAAGVHATWWLTPVFGARATAKYFDGSLSSSPTQPPTVGGTVPGPAVPVHGWSFGIEAVARPFALGGAAPAVSRLYGYAGVSRLATGFSGDAVARPESLAVDGDAVLVIDTMEGSRCAARYVLEGVCLLEHAGRVQLSAGVGTELPLPVRGLVLYADLGVQLYRAPAAVIPVAGGGVSAALADRSPGPPVAAALAGLPGAGVHNAVTGHLTLGAKYETGAAPTPLPPPPPPPPPPTLPAAGATVSVRAPAGAAEVYLVPVVSAASQPRLLCRLRPDAMSPYFKGYATPEAELQVNGTAQPYILVVRSGSREQRIRVSLADGTNVVKVADLRQASVPVCRR
jgi:hypothetical protein